MTLLERFENKYMPEPNSGCWIWTACVTLKRYGQIGTGGKHGPVRFAHRISWTLFRGPIPDGLQVLHKCDNPPCVNPNHLFIGTARDNTHDAINKNRIDFKAMNEAALLVKRANRKPRKPRNHERDMMLQRLRREKMRQLKDIP